MDPSAFGPEEALTSASQLTSRKQFVRREMKIFAITGS